MADNLPPTTISLSGTGIAENAAIGTYVALLDSTDPEGQPITYTLSDDAGGVFKLVTISGATRLALNATLDYEVTSSYDIKITASDGVNQIEQTFTIDVLDVTEDGFAFSVAENLGEGVLVATLDSPISADLGYVQFVGMVNDVDSSVYFNAVMNDAGDKWSIYTTSTSFDYESVNISELSFYVIDYNTGSDYYIPIALDITDVDEEVANQAPSDITLSNTTLSESARIGAVVGTLSATDADGDAITFALPANQGDNNGYFALKTNSDGTVSVVLKNPLDFEGTAAVNGVYDLVVDATDAEGNTTRQTIQVQSTDDPFKLSSVPTGKDYTGIVESAPKGTEIGFIQYFDSSYTPVSATLTDDADGLFSITTRKVGDETRYFLTVNDALDFEADDRHEVTIRTLDANGVAKEKTIQVHVLDAPETGDVARGTITIDANTLLAKTNGGINWNSYLDQKYSAITPGLPGFLPLGSGWSPNTPATEFFYSNTSDGSVISIVGSNLVYNWTDPISGEDAHVVSGTINSIAFGTGDDDASAMEAAELTISGLDLTNDSGLLNRIEGDAQIMSQAWMYGPNGTSPSDIEYVKALMSSYAQHFIGSKGNDKYTGTIFADTVEGGKGNDVLKGGAGQDIINGGAGTDKLYGGGDADIFVFAKGDSAKAKSDADTIFDFKISQGDMIDLSGWDANSKKSGDQDFTFIGSESYHGKAGELRFAKANGDTWIMGDTNGDKKADFTIHLDGVVKLTADQFDF